MLMNWLTKQFDRMVQIKMYTHLLHNLLTEAEGWYRKTVERRASHLILQDVIFSTRVGLYIISEITEITKITGNSRRSRLDD
jgi:hypothetical protein